ncbi:unnamed protein product [Ectocarpus sp. CCAP 1310/34]|nr:unnamed protein product [Ectocarpus sp. CCAP 1310/34]
MVAFVWFCSVQSEPEQAPKAEQIAGDQCVHADVILGDGTTPKADIPEAETVVFGKDGEGIESVGDAVITQMVLTQGSFDTILRVAATAEEHGVPLLMRFGETQTYVVYHPGHRSIPGSWAHVETDFPQPPGSREESTINEKADHSKEADPVQGDSLLLPMRDYFLFGALEY